MTIEQQGQLHGYIITFAILMALTLLSCWVGDSDVVYNFLDRKPTGKEAIARIRFVLLKILSSIHGGGILAFYIGSFLKQEFSFISSDNEFILLIYFCIAIMYFLIGVIQNIIRYIQGRKIRPIFEFSIIKHNLKLWMRPRD